MKLEDFDFDLLPELIAQTPVQPRSASRMMIVEDKIIDAMFTNFIDKISPKDLVIMNNSKVIPAQLEGLCRNKVFHINLHKKISENSWLAFVKKAKYLNVGDEIIFGDNFSGIIGSKNFGEIKIDFNSQGNLLENLEKHGKMPLPLYIKSFDKNTPRDYQTVYALDPGSVAAPTAGLHFTEDILKDIASKASIGYITLHVGAGTFLPIKVDNIADHKMHSEEFYISQDLLKQIEETKKNGGKIIAIGTTTLRALESHFSGKSNETNIFITPGYKFKIVDMLLTNFHLPKSTLFMLVCAFAGYEKMKNAYSHACRQKYRFFSYGDCNLLTRDINV
jgi:S-adenosylmethionine:tRNA ribosyltransferase-isomerase